LLVNKKKRFGENYFAAHASFGSVHSFAKRKKSFLKKTHKPHDAQGYEGQDKK